MCQLSIEITFDRSFNNQILDYIEEITADWVDLNPTWCTAKAHPIHARVTPQSHTAIYITYNIIYNILINNIIIAN